MRARRFRGDTSVRRRATRRAAAPTLRIFCEGSVTEPRYFTGLARHVRASSVTVSREHGDPKHLVEQAAEHKRRGRTTGYRIGDHVWCVFDADDHERLQEAIVQARDNDIPVALSNPCFELWALLHFRDQTAYIERGPLRAQLQVEIPRYDKELPLPELLPKQDDAIRRAQALVAWHEGNGSPAHENPSTGVWQLVETLVTLRTAP